MRVACENQYVCCDPTIWERIEARVHSNSKVTLPVFDTDIGFYGLKSYNCASFPLDLKSFLTCTLLDLNIFWDHNAENSECTHSVLRKYIEKCCLKIFRVKGLS